MKKLFGSLVFRLIVGVLLGIFVGLVCNEVVISILDTIKYMVGQVIFFCVPLIIIGFIAPSITSLPANAPKLLGVSLLLAYLSSIGAAAFSAVLGYTMIPGMHIVNQVDGLRELPPRLLEMDIPPVMAVMSALVLSILIGLGAVSTKSQTMIKLLADFQKIVLYIVDKAVIPLLPVFITCTFATLSYKGTITNHLPVFLKAIVFVIAGHLVWVAFLYLVSSLITRRNAFNIVKHYGPACLTAIGTMSSAATLSVALNCASKSKMIRKDIVNFGIPLFANIHLCGSVLTEVFFVLVVSKVLYGQFPPVGSMALFIILLGVFAIGAPGVPGGTVMASLGLVMTVLGFDAGGTALLMTIYALQDSFGTACNITGDGALANIVSYVAEKDPAAPVENLVA